MEITSYYNNYKIIQIIIQNIKDIKDLFTAVDKNTIDIANIPGISDITELSSTVSQHTTDITTLNSTVYQNSLDITELSNTIDQNTTDITELSNTVEQNNNKNSTDIINLKKLNTKLYDINYELTKYINNSFNIDNNNFKASLDYTRASFFGSYSTTGKIVLINEYYTKIYGIEEAKMYELIEFPNNVFGMIVSLIHYGDIQLNISGNVIYTFTNIVANTLVSANGSHYLTNQVNTTGVLLGVPIGPELIGRITNTLGYPVDGLGPINAKITDNTRKSPPTWTNLTTTIQPIISGMSTINISDGTDSIGTIEFGSSNLLVGTYNTIDYQQNILINTIIETQNNIYIIYISIGKQTSDIVYIKNRLYDANAMNYTGIILAPASSTAFLQIECINSGLAMARYFRDRGENVLVVIDGLTPHTQIYLDTMKLNENSINNDAYPISAYNDYANIMNQACIVSMTYVTAFTQGYVVNKTGSLTILGSMILQDNDTYNHIESILYDLADTIITV